MIRTHRAQLDLGDQFIAGFIAEQPDELWEPWMRHADEALQDQRLLEIVQAAWNKHCKRSKTRGRPGAPAEMILRLLLLKHIRDWSYEEVAREVRANVVYRQFTRIGGGKVPDDKSISRFGRQLGPEVVAELHQRVVAIAQEKKVIQGRKLRVDTTVVETNIHYPTDSTLLSDGVRVLTRVMKKVSAVAGAAGAKLRDRTRSVKRRILEITRASRDKSEKGREKLATAYGKLLEATGPRCWTGQEVLCRDRRQGQARPAQDDGQGQTATGRDDPARRTSHAADASESAGRRHASRRQDRQRL
jgi:IS5 family transposase